MAEDVAGNDESNAGKKLGGVTGKGFMPGQSGNPAGSSKKQRLTAALLKLIEERELDEAFADAGMRAALEGDFNFWKYIFERIDGKIPDKLEVQAEQSTRILKVPAGRRKRQPDDHDGGDR